MKESEDLIQATVHQTIWNKYKNTRGLCYHIPNGGLRTAREGNKLKAVGVVAGIPDYHVAIPANGKNSLYIEFKEPGANMNTEHVRNQLKVHDKLKEANNEVLIFDNSAEAIEAIERYLTGTKWLEK